MAYGSIVFLAGQDQKIDWDKLGDWVVRLCRHEWDGDPKTCVFINVIPGYKIEVGLKKGTMCGEVVRKVLSLEAE